MMMDNQMRHRSGTILTRIAKRNFVAKHAKSCGAGRHGGQAKYSRKVKHKHYSGNKID